MERQTRTLTYDEIPVIIAKHYYEEDVIAIKVVDFPAEGEREATSVLLLYVEPLEPREDYSTNGIHRWQKSGTGAWEFIGKEKSY